MGCLLYLCSRNPESIIIFHQYAGIVEQSIGGNLNIETSPEFSVLPNAEFLKFTQGMFFRLLGRYVARALQNAHVVEYEKAVESLLPVLHGHGKMVFGAELGHIEIHGYQAVQRVDLFFREIVLRDENITANDLSARFGILPRGEAHVRLFRHPLCP